MTARIKEMEMEREVDRISVVMEGKQIKSMSEVKAIEITVPAPGGVRIGIMSGAGTDPDPVFGTGTNLMAISERVVWTQVPSPERMSPPEGMSPECTEGSKAVRRKSS